LVCRHWFPCVGSRLFLSRRSKNILFVTVLHQSSKRSRRRSPTGLSLAVSAPLLWSDLDSLARMAAARATRSRRRHFETF
jgi:hypothetical protein